MNKTIIENPFAFGGTVKGRQFIDREEERAELIQDIENHANLVLYAPRRYGKSSLILQVFEDIKKTNTKFIGLYIDFFKIHSREKFLQILSNEYSKNSDWSADKIISFFKSVISSVQPSLTLNNEGQPELNMMFGSQMHFDSFEEIMNLPQKLAEKGYVVCVVFDEFQEIIRLNGNDFQRELRSVIQHHSDVSYLFCGSKQHLISQIFSVSESPLYNIGKMKYINKILEEKFVPYIRKNIKSVLEGFTIASGKEVYRNANGIPYYVQMLAYELFNFGLMNPDVDPELLIEKSVKKIVSEKSEEYLIIYEGFSPSVKKILEMVISTDGTNMFSQKNLANFNIPGSTLRKGLTILSDKGILTQTENVYSFPDVFFQKWLECF